MPGGPSYQTMSSGDAHNDEESGAIAEAEALLGKGASTLRDIWDGFVQFASGNVAFGLILATTLTEFIKSLTNDLLMPFISAMLPIDKNMEEKFAVLQPGDNYDPATGYNTLLQAKEDGALVLAYGSFVNQIISIGMTGFAMYAMARVYGVVSGNPLTKKPTMCPYCDQVVSEKALRCIQCTSWLDGREEKNRMRAEGSLAT